jgi:hypothetical protein
LGVFVQGAFVFMPPDRKILGKEKYTGGTGETENE